MSEYDVLINKYDALNADYDQLYPKPMKHANTHANGGADPITPGDIGAYSKNETDTLLANKAPANIAAYSNIALRVGDGESIQEAINSIPQELNGHGVVVYVYGSHTENVNINGFSGYSYFQIALQSGALLTGQISVYGHGKINIVGANDRTSTITNTSGSECIISAGGGMVECNNFNIATTGGIAVLADYSSRLNLMDCTVKATGSGNYKACISASHVSEITANSVTIESGTPCGLASLYSSLIRFKGTNNATAKSTTYSGGEVVTLS